ncbi:hypothetical protein GGE66_003669 [Rhizobium leguminosarum]|nr:hypothetical protein [Rhizobium leguminosarum]
MGPANLTSLVERKSRYTVMIKNQSRHSRPIMDKITEAFSPLPAFARQSFTFDRGTEFAGFRALEDGIGARSLMLPGKTSITSSARGGKYGFEVIEPYALKITYGTWRLRRRQIAQASFEAGCSVDEVV